MDITEVLAPVRDLGAFIRQQRESAQISVRQLARQAGVSNPYLSQVERGLRRPSAEILVQIARGLQISVESLLTMAGILDEPTATRPDPLGLDAAIDADPFLTARQKASLREIYLLYRRDGDHAGPVPTFPPSLRHEVPAAPSAASPGPVSASAPHPSRATRRAAQHEGDHHVVRH